jgi:hypothetical protein
MANEDTNCKYCDLALSLHSLFQLRMCLADYQRKDNIKKIIQEQLAEDERERRALVNQLTNGK